MVTETSYFTCTLVADRGAQRLVLKGTKVKRGLIRRIVANAQGRSGRRRQYLYVLTGERRGGTITLELQNPCRGLTLIEMVDSTVKAIRETITLHLQRRNANIESGANSNTYVNCSRRNKTKERQAAKHLCRV